MQIPRERFINKLRELGFQFAREAKWVWIWRRGQHECHVRKRDLLSEEFVRSSLRQAGCADADIDAFIECCKH